jgi:hypothetical protein
VNFCGKKKQTLLVSATKLKISKSSLLYFRKTPLLTNCLKRVRIQPQTRRRTLTIVPRRPEPTVCFPQ